MAEVEGTQGAVDQKAAEVVAAPTAAATQEAAKSEPPAAASAEGATNAQKPADEQIKAVLAELEKHKKTVSAQSQEINRWRQRALDNEGLREEIAVLREALSEALGSISEETKEKLLKQSQEYKQARERRLAAERTVARCISIAHEAGIDPNGQEFAEVRKLVNDMKFDEAVDLAHKVSISHLRSKIPTPEQLEEERKRIMAELVKEKVKVPSEMPVAPNVDIDKLPTREKLMRGVAKLFK